MEEEIFGPLLPVIPFDDFDGVVREVGSRPKPLAAYLFSKSNESTRRFLNELSFGGGCVNDTMVHLSTSVLPFGGVGQSGLGKYRGKAGFDTFTHKKGVLHHSTAIDFSFKYPPFGKKLNLVRRFLR